MAYCTDSEVFAAVKEGTYNALLGEEYIEDVEERKNPQRIQWQRFSKLRIKIPF